jgi:hypothetical protein
MFEMWGTHILVHLSQTAVFGNLLWKNQSALSHGAHSHAARGVLLLGAFGMCTTLRDAICAEQRRQLTIPVSPARPAACSPESRVVKKAFDAPKCFPTKAITRPSQIEANSLLARYTQRGTFFLCVIYIIIFVRPPSRFCNEFLTVCVGCAIRNPWIPHHPSLFAQQTTRRERRRHLALDPHPVEEFAGAAVDARRGFHSNL